METADIMRGPGLCPTRLWLYVDPDMHDECTMETRLLSRQNTITNTSGRSPGYLQANLLILPAKHAQSFHDLCRRNPVPCPLLGTTPQGDPYTVWPQGCIQSTDFDIRTDCPAYRVYLQGKCIEYRRDLLDVWTKDCVGFLIGCSFSFEDALVAAGLPPRHQQTGTVTPMYRTCLPLLPAGIFTDVTSIVSMRPYRPEDIDNVREVTRPFLSTHGEPVAWGWEAMQRLGIADIQRPDFGEAPVIHEGEVPVFWGCGVTPQVAVESAGDQIDGLVFAHEPGNMLVTDLTGAM